ncbi:helix-turn-helix domain-containing protein [Actinokineospora sp.]|uniref:helix-turn-helix domain-containing protein n=1 Tax=Actinokineospora sp. TaxID=1872133 RepID=UPI0040381203
MPTPTVLQLQLGKELKRLREARGWTLAQAIEVLGNQATKLSRLENGQSSVRPLDIGLLYDALGATADEKAWALDTAKHCKQRGRWSGYRSIYGKFFRMAVDLEEDASVINHYQSEMIPGLLQTEKYIRALWADSGWQLTDRALENAVKARVERQQVLTKPNAPQIGFVVSESAVRRMVGDDTVMQDQLRHVASIAELPNVHLQVLPFRARTYPPGCMYPFTMFRIPSPGKSGPLEYVYLEDYDDGRYRDDHESVATYSNLWQRFVGAALDLVQSKEMLLRLADGYE